MSTKTDMAFVFLGSIAIYRFYKTFQDRITSLEKQLNEYQKDIAQLDMLIMQFREHNASLEKHVYELNVALEPKMGVEIDTQTVRQIHISPSTTFTEDTLSVYSDTTPTKRYLWPFNIIS